MTNRELWFVIVTAVVVMLFTTYMDGKVYKKRIKAHRARMRDMYSDYSEAWKAGYARGLTDAKGTATMEQPRQ